MAHQVVVDDPVELGVAVNGVDALVEAVAVVVGVLLGFGLAVELGGAPLDPAAIPDRRTVVVEAAHAQPGIRREIVVEAGQVHLCVEVPGLISRRVARHVVGKAGPVRTDQERVDLGGHRAQLRIAGRDDVSRIGIAYGGPVGGYPSGGGIEDLAPEDGPAEGIAADLAAGQERAEVALFEGVDRRRVAEAGQDAGLELGPVEVDEEEGLVLDDGPAGRETQVPVAERGLVDGEEALGVQGVVGDIRVDASVERVGARLGGVLDESAARMTVLRRIGRGDDRHLLDGFHGRRALLALLVPGGVAEGAAVEEVLDGPGLAAVDARAELASAEHGVAVRGHGEVARLHQEHRLGEADVGSADDREIAVELLVHAVAHVGPGGVEPPGGGHDLDRLRHVAHRQGDIVADGVSGLEHDPRS